MATEGKAKGWLDFLKQVATIGVAVAVGIIIANGISMLITKIKGSKVSAAAPAPAAAAAPAETEEK